MVIRPSTNPKLYLHGYICECCGDPNPSKPHDWGEPEAIGWHWRCSRCRNDLRHKVYFVRSSEGDIKIGRTSQPMDLRVEQLRSEYATGIEVLLTLFGGAAVERFYHMRYARLRILGGGEWFRSDGELLAFIKARAEG